jgi:hypothetical protein
VRGWIRNLRQNKVEELCDGVTELPVRKPSD